MLLCLTVEKVLCTVEKSVYAFLSPSCCNKRLLSHFRKSFTSFSESLKGLFASLPNTRKSRRANTTGSPFHVVNQCFSTGVPRVVARGSAETDRIRLGRSSRPQFYAVVAISTLGSLHRVPWATQTFAEGSAAAKRLKNTAVNVLARRAL